MPSLQELKKKKALEKLRPQTATDIAGKQFGSELRKGQVEKKKHAEVLGDVMRHEAKASLVDKPMYEELNKIPPLEQLDMMRKSIDSQGAPEDFKEETEEERKRRMLENMFSAKGQRLS